MIIVKIEKLKKVRKGWKKSSERKLAMKEKKEIFLWRHGGCANKRGAKSFHSSESLVCVYIWREDSEVADKNIRLEECCGIFLPGAHGAFPPFRCGRREMSSGWPLLCKKLHFTLSPAPYDPSLNSTCSDFFFFYLLFLPTIARPSSLLAHWPPTTHSVSSADLMARVIALYKPVAWDTPLYGNCDASNLYKNNYYNFFIY